tara:strand:+ start:6299 stop:6868 length:570 start_codon:yes stop_codon:yes gene_type:complete
MWARSGMPLRHKSSAKGIHSSVDRESSWWATYEYISKRLNSGGSIFILTGKRGVGKTQMAVCLARLICLMKKPVHYKTAADLYCVLKSTFGTDQSESAFIDKWTLAPTGNQDRAQLLVIDELHDRSRSDWEDRILNQIVDRRYGNCLDTIMVTNEDRTTLPKSIGSSIISRADETGGIVECLWESFRTP